MQVNAVQSLERVNPITRAKVWFRSSPLPSQIFQGSAIFFAGVAVTSALYLKVVIPLSLSTAVPVIAMALAIGSFVLSRLLKHEPKSLYAGFNGLEEGYTRGLDQFGNDNAVQQYLRSYWTKENLYRLIYQPTLTPLDAFAFSKIPEEIKKFIKEQKELSEVSPETLQGFALEKQKHDFEMQFVNKDHETLMITRDVLVNLSEQISKTAEEEEHPQNQEALIQCKETVEFNKQLIEKQLVVNERKIEEVHGQRQRLLKLQEDNGILVEKLRRIFCEKVYNSLQLRWV